MEKGIEEVLGYWKIMGPDGNCIQRENVPPQTPERDIMTYNRVIPWETEV